jgi:Mg2+-importing ATPase
MLPSQILFNNFLYDLSQTTLPSDETDDEATKEPLKWNMRSFGKYIIVFGAVSSIFDFLTFYLLYKVFGLMESGFQTGWFIESIATQVLVIFAIRTKRSPFWKSGPSRYVVGSAFAAVLFAWVLPFTPLATLFSFEALPLRFLFAIAVIVLVYIGVVEIAKRSFYRHYPASP